jgi:hypothetical protein
MQTATPQSGIAGEVSSKSISTSAPSPGTDDPGAGGDPVEATAPEAAGHVDVNRAPAGLRASAPCVGHSHTQK